MKMNKKVIYTAIFGYYDKLLTPEELFTAYDLLCFTDQDFGTVTGWKIIKMDNVFQDGAKMNRYLKIMPHLHLPNYKQSIYIDASILLKAGFEQMTETCWNEQKGISIAYHPVHNCLYQEAKACIIYGKSQLKTTVGELKDYYQNGMPLNYGLSENGILFRFHMQPSIISLMQTWWALYEKGAGRDQISLPFALWQLQIQPHWLNLNPRKHPTLALNQHLHERKTPIQKFKLRLSIKLKRFWFNQIYCKLNHLPWWQ